MQLSELSGYLPEGQRFGAANPAIRAICYDSRRAQSGALFVAVPGFHRDGHRYVADAVGRGAVAVVVQADAWPIVSLASSPFPLDVPCLVVPDTRKALARLAAAFCGFPARRLRVVGITGTDGKTTTSYLVEAILRAAGYRTGLIGTVGFRVGERVWANDSRQTTPEAPDIHDLLARMVDDRVDYAVLESTSHGLALDRVTGCEYDVAVFTNVTSDHLDFHKTREQYLRDKARLLEELGQAASKGIPKTAILNADDSSFEYLRARSPVRPLTYGIDQPSDIRTRNLRMGPGGSAFVAETPAGAVEVEIKLPGRFNVSNTLAALAVGVSQRVPLATLRQALAAVEGVAGRMERVDLGQPFGVLVDYAHTPDSLSKVLDVVRPLTSGRLLLVFGCAGERDRQKRPAMGEIAAHSADFFVLTDEDPRLEDREAILAEIEDGARRAGVREGVDYLKVPDRRQAIRTALREARPGDLLLLAGKGHETSIIVGEQKLPWDERRVVEEELAAYLAEDGRRTKDEGRPTMDDGRRTTDDG